MNVLLNKLKDVLMAVIPVVALVIVISLTLSPVSGLHLAQFIIGALAIVLGLAILLFGIELGVMPFGVRMGESFAKSNQMIYVVVVGFLLGFIINIAEPDLQVVAAQVASVTGGYIPMFVILVSVSVGTGAMLAIGITRIVKNIPMNIMLTATYGVVLALGLFSSADMLAIGFDTSGATTGALTVPLVLALSAGVAAMKRDSKSSEADSFGLVGLMSAGAPLGVLILNQFVKTDNLVGTIEIGNLVAGPLFGPFFEHLPQIAFESFVALLPVVIMLFVFQKIDFDLHKRTFRSMLMGFLYTYIGLVIFLVGVHAGFMKMGNIIGFNLASYDNKAILVGMGFILGMLVILTEPAVYILTHQIEDVTSGYIKRKTVLVSLSIGVALAVSLSMLRIIVPGLQLWHYLLPGFGLALALSFVTPPLFVGIAFDSGGVATGPMTATFILAFAQGASDAIPYSNILLDSFGVISMVCMTPLLALQILGLMYKIKSKKSGV
ncbi:MAG: DUF1538 domain-containing protein [Oscillospiraceae bacterium]|nr:DUF1538 domain-containing protein [Oscillospiraceae bacterium]